MKNASIVTDKNDNEKQFLQPCLPLTMLDSGAEQANITKNKQVAQLWQREDAKPDTFLINIQHYSQNHAQN